MARPIESASGAIASELDQHAAGLEDDRMDRLEMGPEDDPWMACWGEYAEPLPAVRLATIADKANLVEFLKHFLEPGRTIVHWDKAEHL